MAKKLGKFLAFTAIVGAAVAGGVALFKKYKETSDDFDDDFSDFDDDDFDDDFSDEDDEADDSESSDRGYTPIAPVTDEEQEDSETK